MSIHLARFVTGMTIGIFSEAPDQTRRSPPESRV